MKKSSHKKGSAKKHKTAKNTFAHHDKDFFIAGIGASAGGLQALKQLFDNSPADTGIAFVIVQHLDPDHKSLLSELLGKHTTMTVVEITDGIQVKPNCVYIIPPKKDLKIFHGSLQLTAPTELRAKRRSIDSFFHSLAEDQKEKAIGIVLSGTGSEGTLGLKDIKMAGGIAIVQDPQTAEFSGMPQSAIDSGTADYILPPNEMVMQLLKYIKSSNNLPPYVQSTQESPTDNQLKKIFQTIRTQTGHDFSDYKRNTIVRRIAKRIAINQLQSVEDYITFLQDNPVEIEKLYKDFLIGVTSFFRDKEVFKSVEKKAIPHLLANCAESQVCRVWVCGCSTGEEAYSFAILFKEALSKNKQFIKVMIFATDIDQDAIEFARNGLYTESALAEVSPERLSRFFIQKPKGYQLKKEVREMLVFANHNVIKDPPFSKMDLITCRNLLIYMNSELQKKIIPVFHYSLNDEGILLLGTSESIGEYSSFFSAFDPKIKIFKKKKVKITRRPNAAYELPELEKNSDSGKSMLPTLNRKLNFSGLAEKILLDNYAPPSVIVDKNNDVLYFSGNTGQYLEPPVGEPRLNILEMAKKWLKRELETAIKKARSGKLKVHMQNIKIKDNAHYRTVNLVVKPISIREADTGALMIIFESPEKSEVKKADKHLKRHTRAESKESVLEKELVITRQHLQTAINELETSNEDLQATNEEFQSSNEELQSTNEELETSREELQSVNEELITVNTELSNKIEQLSQANDDLNNLLSSIEVATLFLDRNLKIKRFTPTATKIFNLIPSDIDRPVTHLSSNVVYKTLVEDVKTVLKTLVVKATEVQSLDGTWYHTRILPYRTSENIIEGVLVTFIDITEQKNTEEKLKKTNAHLNLIMENLPAIPFTCEVGKELKFSFVGKSCEKVMGFLPEQFTGKSAFWINRIHPDDKKRIRTAFSTISKGERAESIFRWKCANGKYTRFINHIRYVRGETGHTAYVVGVWQEFALNIRSNK